LARGLVDYSEMLRR